MWKKIISESGKDGVIELIVKILKMSFAVLAILTSLLIVIQTLTPTYFFENTTGYSQMTLLYPEEISIFTLIESFTGGDVEGYEAFEAARNLYLCPIILILAALILSLVGFITGITKWLNTLKSGAQSEKKGYKSYGLCLLSFLFTIVSPGLVMSSYEYSTSHKGYNPNVDFYKYNLSGFTCFILFLIIVGFLCTIAINVLSNLKKEKLSSIIIKNTGRLISLLLIIAISTILVSNFTKSIIEGSYSDYSEEIICDTSCYGLIPFIIMVYSAILRMSGSLGEVSEGFTTPFFGSVAVYMILTIILGLMVYRLFKKDDETNPKASLVLPILLFFAMVIYCVLCKQIMTHHVIQDYLIYSTHYGTITYMFPVTLITATVLSFVLVIINIIWALVSKKSKISDNEMDLTELENNNELDL